MAYLDTRRSRPNLASIGTAIAVNGLMVAAIASSVPDILPRPAWTIIKLLPIAPDPVPIPPETRDRPKHKPVPADPYVPPRADDGPASGAADLTGISHEPGIPSGTGERPIEPVPVKLDPVFRNAAVNPRYTNALQPSYPPGMIREEREGVVTVRVLVGTDGRVKAVEPVRVDAPAFLEATRRQALAKWRFLPATRDGEPVESWREMTVRFELPD